MALAQSIPLQEGRDSAEERGNAFLLLSILIAIALHGGLWVIELPEANTQRAGGAVAFTVHLPVPEPLVPSVAQPFVPSIAQPFVPLEAPVVPVESAPIEPAIIPDPDPPVEILRAPLQQEPVPEERLFEETPAEETNEDLAFDLPMPMAKPDPPPRPAEAEPVPPVEERVADSLVTELVSEEISDPASLEPKEMAVQAAALEAEPSDLQDDVTSQSIDEIALITEPVFAKPPVPPEYPPVSRRRYEEGTVVFRVLVSSGGESEEVKVWKSSGFNRLDTAAEQAVWKWHFAPARKAGIPVRSWVEIPVNFTLN